MKFSYQWLTYFLDTDASAQEVADTLNAIGHEVEGIEDPSKQLSGFRVAKVLTAKPHPDADKLQVLTVDAGDGAPLTVVCGAPNARAGMLGVLGLPGAVVPANGMELRKSKIRGVESNGMMCSVRELGLGDAHEGIIEISPEAQQAVGREFADYAGLDDPIFDVAITPNRPDCMGVMGIARDLATAGLGTFEPIEVSPVAGEGACPVEIRTDDPEGCPALYGRVIQGIDNTKPSPDWMQRQLLSAGQKPINAVVDATNYLMLAYGRPAHAYDLTKLSGPLTARRARNGEQIEALNGKTYTLDETMTVIADNSRVHDIAGIMGGEHSGVTETTTDILLEIAYFDPARIGVTGRKIGLASDARTRFERGVDPAFLDDGMEILTRLITDSCDGRPSDITRVGAPPSEPLVLEFDPSLTERLGGVRIEEAEQRRILEALDFAISDGWQVTVPLRRQDVEGPADLVEEIVRIHGLDQVESVALPRPEGVAKPTATPQQQLERRLRRAAAARGLNEALTWSFLPVEDAEHFASGARPLWTLDNPISEDMKAMRPSMLPGLIMAAKRNADRGASSSRLFEIGRRYLREEDCRSDERPTLGLVLAGERIARGWQSGKAQGFDAFDAKAEALALLEQAGAPVANLQVMGEAGPQFHPGQSATLRLGPKNVLASFGALHPNTLKAFDMDGPVMVAELYLDAIPARKGTTNFARPPYAPPVLQPVTRDFAFLVPSDLPAGDLIRAVRGADKKAIVDVGLFDVFGGQGVPEGRKSLAIEVTLQPGEKSFTEDDLNAISDKVIAAAAKIGGELRA